MEIALVLAIVIAAVVLFVTEKFPMDLVALMVLGALLATGLITPQEGLSGLSNPATVTVAAMFVLSAGIRKTGAIRFVGDTMIRLGRHHMVLLFVMMATVGTVSAFVNNTAAVAVFLPLVIGVAAARKISASRLLIPLSFASQFGGVCTLIGTSTNLIVSSISQQAGYGAFHMFEFARMGLILFGAGILYFLVAARWLLPDRRGAELTENYQLTDYITELRVMEDSPLVGETLASTDFGRKREVRVLELLRGGHPIWPPQREPIQQGDILLVRGKAADLLTLKTEQKLEIEPEFRLRDEVLTGGNLTLMEALVAPNSRFIGQTLDEAKFHRHHNAIVLALQRRGQPLRLKLRDVRLRLGDALLILGPKEELAHVRQDENFIGLQELDPAPLRRRRAPLALGIIAGVVALASLELAPIVVAALLGCIAMALTGCITLEDAYRDIDWRVIVLLAGIIPLGIAMQNTGAAALIADSALGLIGGMGPIAFLAALYVITAVLTECMSNNASAVLMAPIAISTAITLGVDPKPFLMAVAFAASTSFATPVGYQTNTMIYNAGGYRFFDFVRVGLPLNVLFWILAVVFIPRIWPF